MIAPRLQSTISNNLGFFLDVIARGHVMPSFISLLMIAITMDSLNNYPHIHLRTDFWAKNVNETESCAPRPSQKLCWGQETTCSYEVRCHLPLYSIYFEFDSNLINYKLNITHALKITLASRVDHTKNKCRLLNYTR